MFTSVTLVLLEMLGCCLPDKMIEQSPTLSLSIAISLSHSLSLTSRDDVEMQFRNHHWHFIQSILPVLAQYV